MRESKKEIHVLLAWKTQHVMSVAFCRCLSRKPISTHCAHNFYFSFLTSEEISTMIAKTYFCAQRTMMRVSKVFRTACQTLDHMIGLPGWLKMTRQQTILPLTAETKSAEQATVSGKYDKEERAPLVPPMAPRKKRAPQNHRQHTILPLTAETKSTEQATVSDKNYKEKRAPLVPPLAPRKKRAPQNRRSLLPHRSLSFSRSSTGCSQRGSRGRNFIVDAERGIRELRMVARAPGFDRRGASWI